MNLLTKKNTLIICTALLCTLFFTTGCSSKKSRAYQHQQSYKKHYDIIINAEDHASTEGRNILKTTREMYLDKYVIKGGCWDYLNIAYNKAGYGLHHRKKIFSGSKNGPYASSHLLRSGDWVYHINHGYNGVEHSGMFVAWIDRRKKIALMFSYAGEKRSEPARYKRYDLSSVYTIFRPVQ